MSLCCREEMVEKREKAWSGHQRILCAFILYMNIIELLGKKPTPLGEVSITEVFKVHLFRNRDGY